MQNNSSKYVAEYGNTQWGGHAHVAHSKKTSPYKNGLNSFEIDGFKKKREIGLEAFLYHLIILVTCALLHA